MRSIPVNLDMKMTQCKTDELPRVYCWPGDHYFECQWWCLSGESCTKWASGSCWGATLEPKSKAKPSTISFWLFRRTKPLYQTKMLHPFWTTFSEQNGKMCVVSSLEPVARLLVSPGAYKPCWEWVDRCDRPGDFFGSWGMLLELEEASIMTYWPLVFCSVYSQGWNVFVMVGNWENTWFSPKLEFPLQQNYFQVPAVGFIGFFFSVLVLLVEHLIKISHKNTFFLSIFLWTVFTENMWKVEIG